MTQKLFCTPKPENKRQRCIQNAAKNFDTYLVASTLLKLALYSRGQMLSNLGISERASSLINTTSS